MRLSLAGRRKQQPTALAPDIGTRIPKDNKTVTDLPMNSVCWRWRTAELVSDEMSRASGLWSDLFCSKNLVRHQSKPALRQWKMGNADLT
jgi:hypothetical protein